MEVFQSDQAWLVLAAVAVISYILGRASAGRRSDNSSRTEQRLKETEAAAATLSSLDATHQLEIDRLIVENKTIEAIKYLREHTGLSLYEAKLAIDERRKVVKDT
ncbi:MAG TPA: hypothetical protein PLV61_09360 [Parvularculaceae bacterium]|nr:hypothetical protein [Amphiplicatus sp.]HOP18778.1 hypothetical protein [Amphiplicatus sp.]HPE31390.1 hypothetical protein [Parvularculaceae bacterium]HRX40225.1 hypothetical protein [Parvularculaceae bacterium]